MTPLQGFACAITQARKVFQADRCVTAWLVFYEATQLAYLNLLEDMPQVKEIEDFWRYVQNMPASEWLPIIEAEVARITRGRSVCHDCGAAKIIWPERLCSECKKTRRLNAYRKAKEQMRAKQQARKCSVCQVQPVANRQRVCVDCQKQNRKKRNLRYREALKEAAIRRVHADFAREALSTIPTFQVAIRAPKNVEQEGVLVGGVK